MIYSLLYVLVFSSALILIQKLDVSIPPLFSLLITASIACLYFNIINKSHLRKMYSDCLENKKQWVSVMLIVLLMWGTTMIGPGKIGASLFNFIYFAWLGTIGFILSSFQSGKENKIKLYFGLSLVLLLAVNISFELRSSPNVETIYGILLAILGGTASFVYFKQSQYLAKNANLTATQVLAVRFYLSIIVLMIILPKQNIAQFISPINLMYLFLLAFLSLIFPLYFSQKALEKITSEQHAIINSLCPVVTGILQELFFNDLKKEQIVIYFIYSFTILSFYLIIRKTHKIELA
jgi:hypothetical protein